MPELIESPLSRPVILLVEPDGEEESLVRKALAQARLEVELLVEPNPQAALARLRRSDESTAELIPQLVLLAIDGSAAESSELVHTLKSHARLRRTPVVAFTRLESEAAVRELYDLRINAYVVKAPDFAEFVEQIKALHRYWFTTVSRSRCSASSRLI